MGKLKEHLLNEESYTTDRSDNYLTMHRIMLKEYDKWQRENTGATDTGRTILMAKRGYQDGFMEGFCFKFTGEE
jgi:hypothetical protein